MEVGNISGSGNTRGLLSKEECDWTEGLLKGFRFSEKRESAELLHPPKTARTRT